MARQEFRDSKGLKAEIRESGSDLILYSFRSPMGIIGKYCKHNDTTYDKNGRIVGYGNQLATLLS